MIDVKEQAAKEVNQDEEKVDTDELKAKFGRANSKTFFTPNPVGPPAKSGDRDRQGSKDVNQLLDFLSEGYMI